MAVADSLSKSCELCLVSGVVALEEEVENRICLLGAFRIVLAHRGGPDVVGGEHALRAESLKSLVVAVGAVAGVHDVDQLAL